MIELENIWQDYGLDKLEQGLSKLFPKYELSLGTLLEEIMAGDIFGAVSYFFRGNPVRRDRLFYRNEKHPGVDGDLGDRVGIDDTLY